MNIMVPSKRFELGLIYGGILTVVVLGAFWLVDGWSENPLVRLAVCPLLVAGYVLIAYVLRRLYDAKGKRIVKAAA
jgi:hypothetical protein